MNNGKRQNSILSMLALIVIALGVFAYWQQDLPGTTEKLDYSKLVKNINEDKIKEISLQRKDENYNVKGVLTDGEKNFESLVPASDNEIQKQINEKAKDGKLNVVEYKAAEKNWSNSFVLREHRTVYLNDGVTVLLYVTNARWRWRQSNELPKIKS